MAGTRSGAARANGATPGECLACQLSTSEDSAAPGRRQLRTSDLSISSADDLNRDNVTFEVCSAATWLARRGRVTLHHAAALAEAHGLGGAA